MAAIAFALVSIFLTVYIIRLHNSKKQKRLRKHKAYADKIWNIIIDELEVEANFVLTVNYSRLVEEF